MDPKSKSMAIATIVEQLKLSGASSALMEEEYLDQDFTAAFSVFYSTVFKRHTKLCRRFHFFKEDITQLNIDNATAYELSKLLQAVSDRNAYLGFVVIRPLPHAPLGRAVISEPPSEPGMRSEVLVRASYETHVLGAKLKLMGIALTQQDQRLGACAQAAIWMAGRHFHTRHRGPWVSTAAITDAAVQVTDQFVSRSLPAGSEFLTQDNMLRALRAMDRKPLMYFADKLEPPNATNPKWNVQWLRFKPETVIERSIDSGIPVILWFADANGQTVGHVVLATGHVTKERPPNFALPPTPTTSLFCEHILCHDDQRGSNIPVAVGAAGASPLVPHTVSGHLGYIIVPLPEKVFITAEVAEKFAWDTLKKYQNDWPAHKAMHGAPGLGASGALGDGFVAAIQGATVLARTYLTYGWRYKSRMLRNNVGSDFKSVLFYHTLPRLVWVTEFGTFDSLNKLDIRARRIFAHSVVDATASTHWEARSIFHAPGMGTRWYHDEDDPFGDFKDATTVVADDKTYFPKVRGEDDYRSYPGGLVP